MSDVKAYKYMQYMETQRVDIVEKRTDGKEVRKAYYDENGDSVVDGYKESVDGKVVKFFEDKSAKKYTKEFKLARTTAIEHHLKRAGNAGVVSKSKGGVRCIGFDDMKQVHFEGEDGTRYSIYAKLKGKRWIVSAIKVNNADESQPLIILPENHKKVIAPEAQQALKILEGLCE